MSIISNLNVKDLNKHYKMVNFAGKTVNTLKTIQTTLTIITIAVTAYRIYKIVTNQ